MTTVAITGAARGIGEAIARECARRGHRVLLGDLDPSVVDLAASLGGVGGVLDVTSASSYDAWWSLVDRVDVLVNNAGVMWVGRFDDEPLEAARKQLEVNFLGVVRGTRLALAHGCATVVTVASAASYVSPPGEATYAATKHAVLGWMKAVRQEARGTELCLVLPTVVETQLAAGTAAGGVPRLQPEDVARAVADVIARPRFETFVPARVGLLVRMLALLPQRGRDLAYRKLVPDQLRHTDPSQRVAYERLFDAGD